MLGRKLLGLAAAVIALASTAGSVSAASLLYTTSGSFSTPIAGLTFVGNPAGAYTVNANKKSINLGTFDYNGTLPSGIDDGDVIGNFTLTILQTSPSGGTSNTTATIQGEFQLASSNTAGALILSFSPSTFVLGSPGNQIRYIFDGQTEVPLNTPGTTALLGTAQTVAATGSTPLPAAAWGGIVLFGLVAYKKKQRQLAA